MNKNNDFNKKNDWKSFLFNWNCYICNELTFDMGIVERKEKEKQKRRKDILKAAEKIFFGKDGDRGTMDDVAAKVELSKGTLYLYFKNKSDLLYAIAENGVGIIAEYLQKAKNFEKKGIEQLSDLGDEFVRFVEDYPKHFELILRFQLKPPQASTKEPSQVLIGPALNVLKDVIAFGQEDGSVRLDFTPHEIVVILWSQIFGILGNILNPDLYINNYNVKLSRVIRGHYKIILKGVAVD